VRLGRSSPLARNRKVDFQELADAFPGLLKKCNLPTDAKAALSASITGSGLARQRLLGGDVLTLHNVQKSGLQASDFLLV
jgi:hypothetical protein